MSSVFVNKQVSLQIRLQSSCALRRIGCHRIIRYCLADREFSSDAFRIRNLGHNGLTGSMKRSLLTR